MIPSQTPLIELSSMEPKSLCATAAERAFVRSIGKDSLIGMVVAVADKRAVKVLFTSKTVEQLSKSKHFIVNLFPTQFRLFLIVQDILLNVKVSIDNMLDNDRPVKINKNLLLKCFRTD